MNHEFKTYPCFLCGSLEIYQKIIPLFRDGHVQDYGDLFQGRTHSEWTICARCGFLFQNPRISMESLQEFYKQGLYHRTKIPEHWKSRDTYRRFAYWYYQEKVRYALGETTLRKGTVLDIGCGHGGALLLFQELGWDVIGVEPDPDLAAFALNLLGKDRVFRDLSEIPSNIDFDLVFTNHSFEHFVDLAHVMTFLRSRTQANAGSFVAVPTYKNNLSSLSLRWMNSAHYYLFNDQSLAHLFANYGFSPLRHTYRGWWKEIDEVWFMAKKDAVAQDPALYYEDPRKVSTYLRRTNPLRSILFFPLFSFYAQRIRLLVSAIDFFKKHLGF